MATQWMTSHGGDVDPSRLEFQQRIWDLYPWKDYRFQLKHSWILKMANSPTCYLLQVSAQIDDRTPEKVSLDLDDNVQAQSYAHRFNQQFCSDHSVTMFGEVPLSVKVVRNLDCEIAKSPFPALLREGETALLTPLPHCFNCVDDVEKFLFDASEEYVELAHSFLHYSFFISDGKELVTDLQGVVADDSLILLDPVVLRTAGIGSSLLTAPTTTDSGVVEPEQLNELFRLLYPRVTHAGQTFDPNCRARAKKHLCGVTCF